MPAVALNQGRLDTAQVEQYWEDGFLFPIPIMDEAEAADWRAGVEATETAYPDGSLPSPLNQYLRVNTPVVLPLAAKLASDRRILDVVEGVLGPNLLVWGAEFFDKAAHSDKIVSMHQDLTYWGLGATSKQVTAWLALSPATRTSGCMALARGSHKNPILPHNDTFADENLLSRGQEVAVDVAESDRTYIELQPGQMSLHHGLTIHGSGPNTSDDRRLGFAIRFVAPEAVQHVADRDYAMLVRGADLHGNFVHYVAPPEPFTPASLELYARIRDDQAAALTKGAEQDVAMYASESR
ncbi:MAG: phytanoyl-CoA dioxygenase family protein [Pseudomonadota bacterium]